MACANCPVHCERLEEYDPYRVMTLDRYFSLTLQCFCLILTCSFCMFISEHKKQIKVRRRKQGVVAFKNSRAVHSSNAKKHRTKAKYHIKMGNSNITQTQLKYNSNTTC